MADNNAYFVEALRRFGGMYGSAWRDGVQLLDTIEVSGAVDVNRMEMAMVGRTRLGYKRGRESQEGTLRTQKFDSSWERFVFSFTSKTLEERLANRGDDVPTFDLKIEFNDPDTYAREAWQLTDCQIWRLPLGFSITDDVVEREYPLTWEEVEPLNTFTIDRTSGAVTEFGPGQ